MDTGPVSYKAFAGQPPHMGGGLSPADAPSRPQRLDGVTAQNHQNIESLVSLIDKLRSIRSRLIGEVPEAARKDEARALKSGHVGKLEDQAEGIACGLGQAHEILADILAL